ncbi:MAG TPA: UvrD-helicase domain-containing protein [Bryobacteraceae bacterium]|nr:UvrD-helicase domain-containing protein [Bryobacteraceae bacterium]
MGLTSRQQQAVEVEKTPRDTCVVAGPGSGKTTVLVEYFVNLVESGVDPLRILAITFTDKAANNMRERLAAAFRDRAEIRGKLERAYVSTVDGFCTRLLKECAIFAGIDPDFRVLDERESLHAQRECVDQALDELFAQQPDRARGLMRGLATVDTGSGLLGVYDAIRAAGVGVGELARYPIPQRPDVAAAIAEARRLSRPYWKFDQQLHLREAQECLERIEQALPQGAEAALRAVASFQCNLTRLKSGDSARDQFKKLKEDLLPALEYSLITEYYAAGRATLCDLFTRFDHLYRARKQQLAALDYADLEEYAVRLLHEHPDVRQRVQHQFDQILMDELQDTNGLQARLLELLRRPDRFYAVGDINQSIYGFRHADPDVFRHYRDAVAAGGGRLVELVENFRSRREILTTVETVADGVDGVVPRALVPGKSFAEKAAPSVEVLAAADGESEARWVAARIVEMEGHLALRDGPAEFRDFALLVRNSEVVADFTRAFDEYGIPYVVNRGKGFYESREVVDLMHLLRVIVNPRDEISMAAVLRSPFVATSDDALLRLKSLGNLGSAVEQLAAGSLAAFAAEDAVRLAGFRDRLARWRAARDYAGIDRLLMRAIDECGYQAPDGPRGAANLEKFVAQARAAGSRETLAEFVDEIQLLRASQPREPDAPPEDSVNAVKIMTVHTAKGLEFPVVFLAAMHKGVDTNPGALSFSPRIGLGANWRHPLGGKDKSDSFHRAVKDEIRRRETEEGNRLLYVAMTRAEEHLVLSYSLNGKKPQNWAARVAATLPVRWLDAPPEAPAFRLQNVAAAAPQVVDLPPVAGQYDAQANITSVALFAGCPRRYYLSRYLGFEGGGTSSQPAIHIGQQVHALLAGMPAGDANPEAQRLADVFRKSPLGRRAAAAATVEREFDFLVELENIVLRGQIDLWFEDRGRLVLVDYKTDRTADAAPYELQLRLYALALERLTGRAPDEAYLCFLRSNTTIAVDLRPSLFDSPELVVREFRQAQERQEFPLRESEHCRACPHFMRLCPAPAAPAPASPNPA